MNISSQWLALMALFLIIAGALVLWLQYRRGMGQRRHMDELLSGQHQTEHVANTTLDTNWKERLVVESRTWLDTKLGQQLVADEDRALLVQCGYQTSQSKSYFLLARIGLALALPLITVFFFPLLESNKSKFLAVFAALILGFLIPKWYLRKKAAKRNKQAAKELLILVDLLGLLQGAGLGIDQSLHLMAKDFRLVMPVLSGELDVVNRLHASGRTREQALHRMSEMFQSDALADLSALIVQIDKHGGAVQEPLRQFAERLREQRRMRMKEDIGKITVKMTGVMILTLLPSLLIVTAGPGFLSVIRALGGMK